ncbi:Flp pilus assembly protein CpaB [Blastococcus sp. TML/M2B]|uniref:Flp pilus assembly protein CpaB n=1 Tax=unclassified Blastococcus TaxID=2619396 RepID=UPI0019090821|nr:MULTISPECIES: Flp pilus assembly protein CpaB [unclassified Blastococcus]MBN1091525.1 Flp pilus assembly protein CpaB [Blastococcus sp. TML/M2B]MBN1094924.1 Flp pilus assembly protein CpaB [Blastococcus sp. TML/C7B]
MPRFRRPRSPAALARRVAALLLTATALVLALRPGPPAGAAAPEPVPVVVAARSLDAGRALGPGDLALSRYAVGTAPGGVVADPALLVGRVLAGPVRAGEPLTDTRLVGPGLTALLTSGQVAAPVRLADLSVAALVRTGDRVDVLATAPGAAEAEVLAAGVRVLAAGGSGEDRATGLLLVAVDPPTAARLAAASTSDTLTVSLPPP